MGKTPEYTKKAINNYRDKFDFIQIRFPKGTKDRLQSADVGNINDYVVKCVLEKLNNEESTKAEDTTPDTESAEITPVEPETPEPAATRHRNARKRLKTTNY